MDRYDRQQAIEDWDQSQLTGATLAIAGSGPMAFFAGLMATAMGFGRLVLFGGGKEQEADSTFKGLVGGPVAGWAEFYRMVNPAVHTYSIPRRVATALVAKLPALDVLMICGNDLQAVKVGEQVAAAGKVRVVAGTTAGPMGLWGLPRISKTVVRLAEHSESALTSQIVAALLIEEARKRLMPLKDEAGPVERPRLFALPKLPGQVETTSRGPRGAGNSMALIGAGALGTWLGMGLGAASIKKSIDLYDADTVEETNLNRQVLFYRSVGKAKSLVLAKRLNGLFPKMQISAYQLKVDHSTETHLRSHGLLAACPDNFKVRAHLNQLARAGKKMLLNGGTSPHGGACMTYAPGTTPCLDCLVKVDKLAQEETQAQGCVRRVQSSVVTSNVIIGALMAWQIKELMQGRTQAGIVAYDGRGSGLPVGVHSVRPACRCHQQH